MALRNNQSSATINVEKLELGHAPQSAEVEDTRRGNIFGAIANCVNTVIGAGVLSIPFSVGTIGWALGAILLILGAFGSWFSVNLLNRCALILSGYETSYGEVARRINIWYAVVVDILLMILLLFVSILYLGISANFVVDAFKFMAPNAPADAWYLSRTFFLTLIAVCVCGPLSYFRKVTFLQYTSAMAVFFILYTVVLTAVYATKPANEICGGFMSENNITSCYGPNCCVSDAPDAACCVGLVSAFIWDFKSIMQAIPTFITAYTCQPQIFSIYNDLRNATPKKMDIVSGSALSICALLYILMGICGYVTYGSHINDDLLGSYPLNVEVTIARLGLGFVVAVSYPLLMHPTRDAVLNNIFQFSKIEPDSKTGTIMYYSVVTFLVGLTYLVAFFDIQVTIILRIAGIVSTANLMFTFPAIYYWILFKHEGYSKRRIACIPTFFAGIFISLVNAGLWIAEP